MKKKVFFIIFMATWVILVLLNFIIKSNDFSEQENRYLAKIPKFSLEDLIEGEYAEKLNDYINDHFIARNFWLKFNSFIQLNLGKTENNGVYIGKNGYLFEKYEYGETEKQNLVKIANSVNNFSNKLEIPVYFMLIPNSIYINQENVPNNAKVYNQSEIIKYFYDMLDVKTVNVTDTFLKNKNLNLFFKTDHHITSDGAYLAYVEFCHAQNIEAVPLQNFEKEIVSKDFLGTFDSKAQVFNQQQDEIVAYKNETNQNVKGIYDGVEFDSIFNEEYLDKKDKYSYFLNGNSSRVVIKTKVKNAKRLMVIKDSYAHIMAQFLCQNYEEVHFVDPRYYKLSLLDYIEENNITDVLFLYNVSNMLGDIYLRGI